MLASGAGLHAFGESQRWQGSAGNQGLHAFAGNQNPFPSLPVGAPSKKGGLMAGAKVEPDEARLISRYRSAESYIPEGH